MSIISGFDGQPAEPTYRRRKADVVAPLAEIIATSQFTNEAPPPSRPWQPPVSSFNLGGLLDKAPMYGALDRLDSVLAECWQAHVKDRVEPLREVVNQLEQLDGDERRELREHERLLHKALAENKAQPRFKPTDWTARRAELESLQRVRLELARASYHAYADLARERMPAALKRTAAQLEAQRAEAARLWQAAERAVQTWRSSVWLCDEVARRLDPDGERLAARMSADAREVAAEAARAMPALDALLGSQDAVLSGARHFKIAEPSAGGR